MGPPPNPRRLQWQTWLTLAITSLPLLGMGLLTAAMLAIMIASRIPPGIVTVLIVIGTVVVARRWGAALQEGRAGIVPELAARQRVAEASGLVIADCSEEVHRAALSALGEVTVSGDRAPQLAAMAAEVAAQVGVPAPPIGGILAQPFTVVLHNGQLFFGAGGLSTVSVDELRAHVAYELWFVANPQVLAAARRARLAATVGALHRRDVNASFGWINRPAAACGEHTERLGAAYVAAARLAAEQAADSIAGRGGATVYALHRELASRALWPEVLGAWQRWWAAGGGALRPFASWPDAVAAASQSGRTLGVDRPQRADALSGVGWPAPNVAVVTWAPAPPLSALDGLGEDAAASVLSEVDDVVAAAYFGDWVAEAFGHAHRWAADQVTWVADADGTSSPVAAPALTGFLPGDHPPLLCLLGRQVDALASASLLCDTASLAVALAIEQHPACWNAGAAACATAWLSGDATAAARLDGWLERDPACVGTISGLLPTLRTAGLHELAGRIDGQLEAHGAIADESLRLQAIGSGRRIVPAVISLEARRLLDEAAREFPGIGAWVVGVQHPGAPQPVALLVTEQLDSCAGDQWLERWGPLLGFAIPGLRHLQRSQLEFTARRALRRRGEALPVPPAPARPWRAARPGTSSARG